ncbi:serendipity locus protein alpha-like [Culicoides brevitarsis]|uniref:serendipity locus protein alpha-like n=1 Tax=Culicoides brevitarsis TaxID=469753 RepID=UPI00307BD707
MEELYEAIKNCENILYRGFSTTKSSNSEWLNKCCGCFSHLLKLLHEIIVDAAKSEQRQTLIENIFLCIMQIVTGIKFMEQVTDIEETKDLVLTSSRQFFLDEILKSLQNLKEVAENIESKCFPAIEPTLNECIDTVLELLEPLCTFEEVENVAERNANAMISVAKIKPLVESIVSHTLDFSNVCISEDKTPISVMCQKVLKECQALEEECSLSDPKKPPNDANRRLKADILEAAMYQLENLINDALLRLVIDTFKDLKCFSVKNLLEDSSEVDPQEIIDGIIDRLFQIGRFGIMFADEMKVSALIKHSLSAFEALESHLSPGILKKYDENHRFLLESHWNEQTSLLQSNIQKIIDTKAICSTFEEILDATVTKLNQNFDVAEMKNVLVKANVLADHFRLNLTDDSMKQLLKDFHLMMKECHAALNFVDKIDSKRLVKRLKILKTTVKKIREGLKPQIIHVESTKEEEEGTPVKKQRISSPIKLLPDVEELIIIEEKSLVKPQKIETIKKSRQTSYKFDANVSKIIQDAKNNSTRNNGTRTLKRNKSLRRMAMRNVETANFDMKMPEDKSLSLHITEILENITNVSSTFSSKRRHDIEMSRSNKIRIHIIGDV